MTLKKGIHFQVLIRDIPAQTNAQRVKLWFEQYDLLSERVKRAIAGILVHEFKGYPLSEWQEWEVAAKARGLQCGIAYGAGGISDAKAKGIDYSIIGRQGTCSATLIDIEVSTWEGSGATQAATDLCAGFRAGAARAQFVCETWHIPTMHPGVPYEVFQAQCDAFASMDYCNDFVSYGLNRYWFVSSWVCESWGELYRTRLYRERNNKALLPRIIVYQAYGWDGILLSLVTALFVADNLPTVLWEQNHSTASPRWWIPQLTIDGINRFQAIKEHGYSGPAAVWDFQRDFPSSPLLKVDGLDGPATAAASGAP